MCISKINNKMLKKNPRKFGNSSSMFLTNYNLEILYYTVQGFFATNSSPFLIFFLSSGKASFNNCVS